MMATPLTASAADQQMAAAFGSKWNASLPANVLPYFLSTRFEVPGYYLGIPRNLVKRSQMLIFIMEQE